MDTIRGFELVDGLDETTIEEQTRPFSCELIDARGLRELTPRAFAAVERGLRASEGPARRVALLVTLADWLRFGDHSRQLVHTLRLFHQAQFDSFAVHQWIRFARDPGSNLQSLLDGMETCLVGPRASLLLRRAASMIRREHAEIDERAKILGQLLLGARRFVSAHDREWLELEVRMLFEHVFDASPPLDDAARGAIVALVERIVKREPVAPARPMPWEAWLAVALVRYRAGQLAFLRRYAGSVFTEADVGASSDRIVTKKAIRDADRVGWAGMMVSATAEDGTGVHGIVDRRWFSPAWFAHLIRGTQERWHVSGRLWRWMPSERGLAAFATQFVREHGGEILIDSERASWCSPYLPGLEALVPIVSQDDRALGSVSREGYFDPEVIDLHCGDPETASSLSASNAETLEVHKKWIETMIAQGELNVVDALPDLFTGDVLTALCERVAISRPNDPSAIRAIVDVLHGHGAPPPSAFRALANDPSVEPELFEIAFTYLVKNRVRPEPVARRLRNFCGLEPTGNRNAGAWVAEPPRDSDVLRFALALDPEAGRALARAYLASHEEDNVMHASLELAAIGTPWAIALLRDARATSYHPACIDEELAGVDPVQVRIQEDERDRHAERLAFGRMWIRNSLDDELLAVLYSGQAPTFD